MRRLTAFLALALVLGTQALLAAVPAGVPPVPGSCRGMACCAAKAACDRAATDACPLHGFSNAGVSAKSDGATCIRRLGCGHSIPGVVLPSLDPLIVQPHGPVASASDSVPLPRSAFAIATTFHPEPLAPPPRA